MTYAKSGLFWSQCFLPSLVIRKAQAGGGKSSLGLLWFHVCMFQPDIHIFYFNFIGVSNHRMEEMCDLLSNNTKTRAIISTYVFCLLTVIVHTTKCYCLHKSKKIKQLNSSLAKVTCTWNQLIFTIVLKTCKLNPLLNYNM